MHYRITCLRDDVLHKLTTPLAPGYGIIGVEDLNLKGLLKNRRVSRSFSDAALGKLLNLGHEQGRAAWWASDQVVGGTGSDATLNSAVDAT